MAGDGQAVAFEADRFERGIVARKGTQGDEEKKSSRPAKGSASHAPASQKAAASMLAASAR
jgi:hypothetical protein